MPVVTVVCGALLIALGLWGKFGTGTPSNTALIPAFLGAPLAALGLAAMKESWLKHAMHAAAALGLLGLIGGVVNLVRVLATGGDLNNPAGYVTAGMTAVCAVFVGLCVNSFVQVRRRRAAGR